MICTCLAASGSYLVINEFFPKKSSKRKVWTQEWLLRRQEKGACRGTLSELRLTDKEDFRKYLRMNTETFQVSTFTKLYTSRDTKVTFTSMICPYFSKAIFNVYQNIGLYLSSFY